MKDYDFDFFQEGLHSPSSTTESFRDEEHNVWNLMLGLFVHHTCRPVLQRSSRDEDVCEVAPSCHFAVDAVAMGNEQMARVRSKSETAMV